MYKEINSLNLQNYVYVNQQNDRAKGMVEIIILINVFVSLLLHRKRIYFILSAVLLKYALLYSRFISREKIIYTLIT